MKILLVCATNKEIAPFLKYQSFLKLKCEVLITGAGMISTVYHLTKKISSKKYDLVVNAGIAGSFNKTIPLGKVVNVVRECFSELGAEDDEKFIHISQLNFEGKDNFPLRKITLLNKTRVKSKILSQLPKVKGITVNTVHGNEKNIRKVKKQFNPDIETMEGAAFFYVCEKEKIPFLQLRSISNYVEKRNKSKWKIDQAVNNLCGTLKKFLDETLQQVYG